MLEENLTSIAHFHLAAKTTTACRAELVTLTLMRR
jgi:hypothetical protein